MQSLEQILHLHWTSLEGAVRNPILFYLGVVGLFVVGVILVTKNSKYSDAGGAEYERRMRLKFAGAFTIVFALGSFGLKEYNQNVSSYTIDPDSLQTTRGFGATESASMVSPSRPVASFPNNAVEDASHTVSSNGKQTESASIALRPSPTSFFQSDTPVNPPNQVKENPDKPPVDQGPQLLREAFQLLEKKQPDAALDKVNAVLQIEPQNSAAYALRGNIQGLQKHWDEAEMDFRKALQWDTRNVEVKFDLAEIDFMQKRYDEARPGFAALEPDSGMGDLALYKVFLCDLLAGHEDAAARELASFNQAGSDASYYFANASWLLYHQKTEQARSWLMSAAKIYVPNKFALYAASLHNLGYLPLPAKPTGSLTSDP